MSDSRHMQQSVRPYSKTECRVYPVSLETGFLQSGNSSEREELGAFIPVPDWDDLGF